MNKTDKSTCGANPLQFAATMAALWRRRQARPGSRKRSPVLDIRTTEHPTPSIRGRTVTILSYDDSF